MWQTLFSVSGSALTFVPIGPKLGVLETMTDDRTRMGRPREFEPETALDEAVDVFWTQGFDATSLQDLLQAMDLSKSSFYQTFGSKGELYLECLDRYRTRIGTQMRRDLEQAESGRAFIESVFRDLARGLDRPHGRRPCLVMNDSGDVERREEAVAARMQRGAEAFEAIFRAAVERAQGEGDVPPEKDATALARYLVSSRSGLLAMRKAGASTEELQDIIKVTLSALDE
jgi:TetR/AcrR family transcriptional repressor of nem operon